jgi:hypothetical protein
MHLRDPRRILCEDEDEVYGIGAGYGLLSYFVNGVGLLGVLAGALENGL